MFVRVSSCFEIIKIVWISPAVTALGNHLLPKRNTKKTDEQNEQIHWKQPNLTIWGVSVDKKIEIQN